MVGVGGLSKSLVVTSDCQEPILTAECQASPVRLMWCPHNHAYHKVSVNRKQGGLSRAVTRVGNNNYRCVCTTCQIQIFSFHSVAMRSTVTKNNLGRKRSVWFILPSQNLPLREILAGTGARAACWLTLTHARLAFTYRTGPLPGRWCLSQLCHPR